MTTGLNNWVMPLIDYVLFATNTGPDEWRKYHVECRGKCQSPIAIENSQTTYDPTLGHFNMQGYDEAQGVLIATNDGHTGGQMSSNLDNSMNIVAHNKYQSKVLQCHIIFK